MTLTEALAVLSTVFSGLINIFNNTMLFDSSLSVYIVVAFVVSCYMDLIFDIKNSKSTKPKEKGRGDK